MEALVKTQEGRGYLGIQDVEAPTMGDNDVMIRVRAAGICGTDLHIRAGKFHCIPPVVIGHEFSGEIVEMGPSVQGWQVGDRVVAEPHRGGCGTCRYCLTGQVEVCSNKRAIGYKVDGCFTPFLPLPTFSLHKIPDNVSYDQAALTEPLAVVIKAVLERSRVEPEDLVVVQGCGPIGLLAAAAAKAGGARCVVITGTQRDEDLRLRVAKEIGIDHAVNVEREDLLQMVRDLTRGLGADLVVEASGAESAIRQAFELVRIDGRIAGLGLTGKDQISLNWDMTIKKAVHLTCSYSSTWTSWERAVSMISLGKVLVDPLITAKFPLTEWEKGFELLENLKAIKVLLLP